MYSAAILADIHGNRDALETVLRELEPTDVLLFGGDYVMNGPRPAETLDIVMNAGAPAVIGNTDLEVLAGDDPVGQWTAARLQPIHIDYLRSLPVQQRITPPGGISPADDLLLVHSTPRDPFNLLILEPHPLGTNFTQTTPAADAEAMIAGARANLIVYGHIHYASNGVVSGQRVASIGSVGFPYDGDPRAAYARAIWDGARWVLEHRRVAYNHEAVAGDIEASDIPLAARYAKMLRRSNWFPRRPTS